TLLLILVILGIAQSAVVKQNVQKTASIRAQLIKEGTYSDYLAAQLLARGQGNVVAQPFVDSLNDIYRAEVYIGTPPQNFTVQLDTASADLWVVDSRCSQHCPQVSGYDQRRFDESASSTFSLSQWPFAVPHVSSGMVGTDVFNVAGLIAPKQWLGVANNTNSTWAGYAIDGVFGLGWPALSDLDVPPPMQNLVGQLDEPLFTIWLDGYVGPAANTLGGVITYGALDSEHCDAQVNYVPLSALTYWQFPMTRFTIRSYSSNAKVDAISDTGTAWIGAPASAVSAIVRATGATDDPINNLYTVPCAGDYPDMVFTIGLRDYKVPSSEYVIDLGLGKGQCNLALFELVGNGFGPDWIFGDTWIRTYCNVYDIGKKRIGFALARHTQ
ncbi:hypothetical protein PENTCL1PPCAC_4767, partial [Pristionchus entomophagus]